MYCIIAGSRTINDQKLLNEIMEDFPWKSEISAIVSGACSGVDLLGENWAKLQGYPIHRFPVTPEQWNRIGKSAGPKRNLAMAKHAAKNNGALVLVWDGKSSGSKTMLKAAQDCGLKIHEYVVSDNEV